MRILIVLALLLQDDVTKGWKHDRDGSKAGDRLKWKITSEAFGQKMSSERTEVVSKVEKNTVIVEYQEEDTKNSQTFHTGLPSELVGTWRKTGEEEVKVGDKAYTCTVYELKKESGNVVQTTRVWKSADAPCWAVKQTWSQAMKGKDPGGWVEELTAIDQMVKVGGKEYKCLVVRKTTEMMGVKNVETLWKNDEVPGRVLKKTEEASMKGTKTGSSVSELIEFEKK